MGIPPHQYLFPHPNELVFPMVAFIFSSAALKSLICLFPPSPQYKACFDNPKHGNHPSVQLLR